MGTFHKDGYSADVAGFFVTSRIRIRLAKTNGCTFAVAESCEFSPGTEGELLTIVDGVEDSRRVVLPDGVCLGQTFVKYKVTAPF